MQADIRVVTRHGQQTEESIDDEQLHLDEICSGLYIGSLKQASNRALLSGHGVVAVVAVGCDAVFPNDPSLSYLQFPRLLDIDSGSIIHTFEQSHEYITEAQTRGSVLVHCVYGSSRSAAVVVAHLMLKHPKLGLHSAHQFVRTQRSATRINLGFLRQLMLFEKMNLSLTGASTASHAEHRLFLVAQNIRRGKSLTECFKISTKAMLRYSSIPSNPAVGVTDVNRRKHAGVAGVCDDMPASSTVELGCVTTVAPTVLQPVVLRKQYMCRSCRVLLFSDINIMDHNNDENVLSLVHASHDTSTTASSTTQCKKESAVPTNQNEGTTELIPASLKSKPPACTSMFIEPLQWVVTQCVNHCIRQVEQGKYGETGMISVRLDCFKCGVKVGQADTRKGLMCSCKKQIWPAFQIHSSRVDERVLIEK